MKPFILLWISVAVVLSSCGVPKDVSYFQGIDNLTPEQRAKMDMAYSPKICIDDRLTINVSAPDGKTAALYNPSAYGYYSPDESAISMSSQTENLYTYLVDEMGNINFPYLGRIHIAGISINEANRMMEEKLKKDVPDVLVNVQIVNFKVSIFGEVEASGTYQIKGNRVTMLDLIAMAGNLTINADRKNVLLIRDNNGKKEFIRFDLTKPDLFESPYYYLQQNDVIYVDPNDAQKRFTNYTEEKSYRASLVTGIVSSIGMIATAIISIAANNKK